MKNFVALDILGLKDSPKQDQQIVHAELKEQLQHSPEGWYETGLPWRGNHPNLSSNEAGSLWTHKSMMPSSVIQSKMESKNKEFYLLHKIPETTKMSIVYDALVRANSKAPLLNECLYPGPSLQNKLWDILVQQTAYPVIMSGDIRKSFIQIRIRECERDALRFHWCKDKHYAKHCHSQGHY